MSATLIACYAILALIVLASASIALVVTIRER